MAVASAFRFAGVGLGGNDPGQPTGLAITSAGRVAMVREDAAVLQSILLLLTTVPGERVMRPTYGCPLDRLMFAPNDATTAGLAIHYVRQALQRWEPRIAVLRLDAGPDPVDPTRLVIFLTYRVRATDTEHHLSHAIALDPGAGG